MKKVLVDLNIILDVLLDRDPFAREAEWLWTMAESGAIKAYISGTSVTNLSYILQRALGTKKAKKVLEDVLKVFRVAKVDQTVITEAIRLSYRDFEDAVQEASARHEKLEAIISRNKKDFRSSEIPVYTASEYVALLNLPIPNSRERASS